jgi:hypothetical protein
MKTLSKAVGAAAAAIVLVITGTTTGASATVAPPVSTLNIPCTKLASATNPPASFATPVSLRNPAISELLGYGQQLLPSTDVIRAAGGTVCEWSNGVPFPAVPGTASYIGVRVEFMHGAESGYWRWTSIGGVTTPEFSTCFSGFCQFDSAAGGGWLNVQVYNARSDAVALSLATRIRTAIQLGQERPWAPVATKYPLGRTCEEVLPASAFRSAVGSPVPLRYFADPPGWSIWHEAIHKVPAPMCSFLTKDGSAGPGWFRTLPSGSWGFDEAASSITGPSALIPITWVPLRSGDRAYLRCSPTGTDCILDAIIAEHWIQVELWPETGTHTITRSRVAALLDILTALQAQIYHT